MWVVCVVLGVCVLILSTTALAKDFELSKLATSGENDLNAQFRHDTYMKTSPNVVLAHVFTLENPRSHFSILPPKGGCYDEEKSSKEAYSGKWYGAAKTSASAGFDTSTATTGHIPLPSKQSHKCLVATNAGFFDETRKKAGEEKGSRLCLGNVVSDGAVLQKSEKKNVQFGITKDNYFFVGYLGNETEHLKFDQLVSGVLWLVRDSKPFVEKSYDIEDMSTQHTDNGVGKTWRTNRFVTTTSARTAIGHDSQGRLKIASVEGKTSKFGIDLNAFADLLVDNGFVNAINLDGGGSATVVEGGMVVNHPSDECSGRSADHGFEATCEREVTTITCIHDRWEPDSVFHLSPFEISLLVAFSAGMLIAMITCVCWDRGLCCFRMCPPSSSDKIETNREEMTALNRASPVQDSASEEDIDEARRRARRRRRKKAARTRRLEKMVVVGGADDHDINSSDSLSEIERADNGVGLEFGRALPQWDSSDDDLNL